MEIITEITHEFGANSRFKGNSFVDCTKAFFFLQFQSVIPLVEINLRFPLVQNEIESGHC
jgi:hypothetical protein